jgi:hypothetical protein
MDFSGGTSRQLETSSPKRIVVATCRLAVGRKRIAFATRVQVRVAVSRAILVTARYRLAASYWGDESNSTMIGSVRSAWLEIRSPLV